MKIQMRVNIVLRQITDGTSGQVVHTHRWLGGLMVERRTSVSQIRGSIPGQVAAV